jgi:hypothetical protein
MVASLEIRYPKIKTQACLRGPISQQNGALSKRPIPSGKSQPEEPDFRGKEQSKVTPRRMSSSKALL